MKATTFIYGVLECRTYYGPRTDRRVINFYDSMAEAREEISQLNRKPRNADLIDGKEVLRPEPGEYGRRHYRLKRMVYC